MADLLKTYQQMADKARLSNLETKAQVEAIHNEIIKRYEPGGTFLAKGEELIQTGKRKATGEQLQQLISSGLYGTTTPGALGAKYEEEIAAPARFKLEDVAMERLSSAQLGKASFLENVQYPYPDYNLLSQAYAAQGSRSRASGSQGQYGVGLGGAATVSGGFGGYAEGSGPGQAGGISSTIMGTTFNRSGSVGRTSGGTTAPATAGGGGYPGQYGVQASGAYIPSPSLQGGGTSTQPKGTGTISGPKGTTAISPTRTTTGLSGAEDPNAKIAEWESYIQTMKSTGANPKRISIEDAQKELMYWQQQAY